MKWGEQARVLKLIPGLENAEFVRFGMIHRNTYINGPTVLRETWQARDARRPVLRRADLRRRGLRRVGRVGPDRRAQRRGARARAGTPSAPPRTTAIGALAYYVSHADPKHYQPTQHHLRHHPAARARARRAASAEEEGGAQRARLSRARARRPGRVDDRGSRAAVDDVKQRSTTFLEHLRAQRERVGAHRARLRERPLAVPRPSSPQHAGRKRSELTPADLDHLDIRAFLGDLHKRGNSQGVGRAQARRDPRPSAAICGAKASSKAIRRRWSARRSASSGCRRTSAKPR